VDAHRRVTRRLKTLSGSAAPMLVVHPSELSNHAERMIKRRTLIAIGYVVAEALIVLIEKTVVFRAWIFYL
jgi:hypothetical protein